MPFKNCLPAMDEAPQARLALALLLAGLILTTALYLPGMSGPWLLDDFQNLGTFVNFAPGKAPYLDLIFSNQSGPLGRPVATASFALNHVLGLFSTEALKATNLGLHLINGTLLFLLFRTLFRHRAPTSRVSPDLFAAILAVWWLLLPIHLSSVLYIIQRMTLLSTLFQIAASLAYIHGRKKLAAQFAPGATFLALSLLVFFPLALLAKESALTFLAGIVLIELFFFQPERARPWLSGLALATLAVLILTGIYPVEKLAGGFIGRDFTIAERLLSEPRALWAYTRVIFLPAGADIGVFHDDFAVSRNLLTPLTTLPALIGLLAIAFLALRQANRPRTWAIACGVGIFLTGHLLESTVVPLELYFDHRNYWPCSGLLLAAAIVAVEFWPGSRRSLALCTALYLAAIATVTGLQASNWGNENRLLELAARHHPASARANDVWVENLIGQGRIDDAITASEDFAAHNPALALSAHLHTISIYCRTNSAVPSSLMHTTANAPPYSLIESDLLALNLDNIVSSLRHGRCTHENFTLLTPALGAWDMRMRAYYRENRKLPWKARMSVAEWLITIGQHEMAISLLRDIYSQDNQGDMAPAGILLSSLLLQTGQRADAATVIAHLAAPDQRRTPDSLRPTIRTLNAAITTRPQG
ncbi:MAG TPA: hypothetical protein VFM34_04800 [Moraxellaceae bacterium]|nr:hypothetical protein [Moraxellaceae bacterium]